MVAINVLRLVLIDRDGGWEVRRYKSRGAARQARKDLNRGAKQ